MFNWIGEGDAPGVQAMRNPYKGSVALEVEVMGEKLAVKQFFDATGYEDPRHLEMMIERIVSSVESKVFEELEKKGIAYGH